MMDDDDDDGGFCFLLREVSYTGNVSLLFHPRYHSCVYAR